MTTLPRALVGPVWGMARPARPAGEIAAVREAAALIQKDTGVTNAEPLARHIATRVVQELFAEIERDDPLAVALAAIEQKMSPSPFVTLATCPEIDTVSEFVGRRVCRIRARSGRYLTLAQQIEERTSIAADLASALAGRYCRHLRLRSV